MAFGLLNSIIPPVGQPGTLYMGGSDKLTVGKVSISSKNSTPARIQLGYEDGTALRYFEYNKTVKYGQTYETQDIHLGAGQKLVARTDQTDINFFFYGQTISDALHPVRSGVLSHIISLDKQKKSIFTAPSGSQVNTTLSVCNMGVEAAVATIGISNGALGDFDSTEYVEYSKRIEPGQTYTRTDIKLKEGQTIIGFSNRNSMVSFVCHGQLFYAVSGLLDSDDRYVLGNERVTGNLGVGITASSKLHVLGDSKLDGALNLTGNLTSQSEITVKGESTNLFSNRIRVKDNNIELGYFTSGSFSGTLIAGQAKIRDVTDTSNLVPGITLTIPTPGTVVFTSGINTITSIINDEVNLMNPLGGTGSESNVSFQHAGPTNATAGGGGIKVMGPSGFDKTIQWDQTTDKWDFNTGINVSANQDYKINDVVVLDNDQVLGFGITQSNSYTYPGVAGVNTSYVSTTKGVDDLITSRAGQVSLSGFFAAGF